MNNSELKIFNYEKTNVRTSIKNGSVPLHRDIMKKRHKNKFNATHGNFRNTDFKMPILSICF